MSIGVANREELLDVVRPGQTIRLASTGGGSVPIIVDWVLHMTVSLVFGKGASFSTTHESTPFRLPHVVISLERRARVGAVAMGSNKPKLAFLASLLDTSKTLAVLLPARAITASDLGLEASPLESWVQDLDEVGSLLTVRLHGRVGRVEIRLVQEADVLDLDAVGLVVLDVPDDLVGVRLPPVASLAVGTRDTAEVPAVVVGAWQKSQSSIVPVCMNGTRTVGLHVPIGTPSISVDGVDTASNGLMRKPDLVLVIPRQRDEVKTAAIRPRSSWRNRLHQVKGVRWRGTEAVAQDGHTRTLGCEKVVQDFLLALRVELVDDERALESLGDTDAIEFLVALLRVDIDRRTGGGRRCLSKSGKGSAQGSETSCHGCCLMAGLARMDKRRLG